MRLLARLLLEGLNDVRVSGIDDRKASDTEVATAGSTESNIVTLVVLDIDSSDVSIVLNVGFAKRRGVVGEENELCLTGTDGLQGGLVAENVLRQSEMQLTERAGKGANLAGLHDQSQLLVERFS